MSQLYLMESGIKVGLREGRAVVKNLADGGECSMPISAVEGISVFGYAQLSTQLIRECISRNISIGYYSDDGHYFGRLSSSLSIDPARQKQQVYLTDDEQFCLEWAKRIISAKIRNSIVLLTSLPEVYEFNPDELHGLYHSLDHLNEADSVDAVLGFEGNAAKCYFTCLPKLLIDESFVFSGRSSRPPKDLFNSMLSYGYSLFYRNIIGGIERHGLHPYFAFMHKLRMGHAALASDLIEEYRAPLVDRTVLDMVNSCEVDADGFYKNSAGAIYMNKENAKKLTNRFSELISKSEKYFLDYGDKKSYGFQAMLDKKLDSVISAIEARDASIYEPYVWRPE